MVLPLQLWIKSLKSEDFNFEKAFKRLEEILDLMNRHDVGLEASLQLYEEANGLILRCQGKLALVEKRVEVLIKDRNKELVLDEEGHPRLENFDKPIP